MSDPNETEVCANCGRTIIRGQIAGWAHLVPGPFENAHVPEPALKDSPASLELIEQAVGSDTSYPEHDVAHPRHYQIVNGPRANLSHRARADDLVRMVDELADLVYTNDKTEPGVLNLLREMGYRPRQVLYQEELAASIAKRNVNGVRVIEDMMFNEVRDFVEKTWTQGAFESGIEFYVSIDPAVLEAWGVKDPGFLLPAVAHKDEDGDLVITVSDSRIR
jgi:hypothetical protein